MPDSPPPSGDDSNSRKRRCVGTLKAVVACDRCRLKKIKCDGTAPCQTCQNIGADCYYSRTARRYRGASSSSTQNLQHRIAQAELLLRIAQTGCQTQRRIDQQRTSSSNTEHDNQAIIPVPHQPAVNEHEAIADISRCAAIGSYGSASTRGTRSQANSSPTVLELGSMLASQHVASLLDEERQVPEDPEPPSRDEVHGPISFASICADTGVTWIASRIGASTYATCATSFMSTISRKLKLPKRLSQQRSPDPPMPTAWSYAMAYFDESVEAAYQTIGRSDFFTRLRKHYEDSVPEDDPGWYALRNVVFASGCRITTSKSCTWTEAQTLAKEYFDNALSVEADLLHGTPGLIAIQALLIMAFFAEGLGGAKLEYMLIGCAVRLAYARGLHLQPASTSVSFEQSERQSWIFWTLYCFEKHLTMRAGRPSVIDDDDISCALPTWAPNTSSGFVECFGKIVDQAMLSSSIAKSFATVKARQRPLREKAGLVKEFNENLQSWYDDLPPDLKTVFPIDTRSAPQGLRAEHILYLHLSYYGNMAAIHSILGHPWNLNNAPFVDQDDPVVKDQIQTSSDALADASRKIVLMTRSISVDAAAPVWLVFYYPLLGMINIFISILKSPAGGTTEKNIGIIDMAAGYFAYLDYSTDAIFSFELVKNLAQWARQAVSQARNQVCATQSTNFTTEHNVPSPTENLHVNLIPDRGIDIDGMDLCDWPTFLPRLPQFTI